MWAAFILCYLDFATALPSFLSSGLVAVGECSFSIYLLHWPIESLLYRTAASLAAPLAVLHLGVVQNVLLITTVFFVPLIILVSQTTYRFIERPFLSMRLKYLVDTADAKPAGIFLESPLLAFIRVTRGR